MPWALGGRPGHQGTDCHPRPSSFGIFSADLEPHLDYSGTFAAEAANVKFDDPYDRFEGFYLSETSNLWTLFVQVAAATSGSAQKRPFGNPWALFGRSVAALEPPLRLSVVALAPPWWGQRSLYGARGSQGGGSLRRSWVPKRKEGTTQRLPKRVWDWSERGTRKQREVCTEPDAKKRGYDDKNEVLPVGISMIP